LPTGNNGENGVKQPSSLYSVLSVFSCSSFVFSLPFRSCLRYLAARRAPRIRPRGDPSMPQLDRRQLLQSLAGAGALAALGPAPALAEKPDRDRIKAEHDREGTLDWQLTYTRVDPKAT